MPREGKYELVKHHTPISASGCKDIRCLWMNYLCNPQSYHPTAQCLIVLCTEVLHVPVRLGLESSRFQNKSKLGRGFKFLPPSNPFIGLWGKTIINQIGFSLGALQKAELTGESPCVPSSPPSSFRNKSLENY